MKRFTCLFLLLLSAMIVLSFSACNTDTVTDTGTASCVDASQSDTAADTVAESSVEETQSDATSDTEPESTGAEQKTDMNTDKYIINMPFYQIYEEGSSKYKYRIETGDTVLIEDIKHGTPPRIDDINDGIFRLHLGSGTNAMSVKYFNVYEKTVSEEFCPFSIYADYADRRTKEYYIAYFRHEEDPKLYIEGFFDCSEFSAELDLDFIGPICNELIFLNEQEIYIEYMDSNSEVIRKVVNFKNEGSF